MQARTPSSVSPVLEEPKGGPAFRARTQALRFLSHHRRPRRTAELFLACLFLFEEFCVSKQLPKAERCSPLPRDYDDYFKTFMSPATFSFKFESRGKVQNVKKDLDKTLTEVKLVPTLFQLDPSEAQFKILCALQPEVSVITL